VRHGDFPGSDVTDRVIGVDHDGLTGGGWSDVESVLAELGHHLVDVIALFP